LGSAGSQDQLLRNEALFRAVNEKLRDLNAAFADVAGETAVLVCECSRLDCVQQVEVTLDVFEDLIASPRRFVLVPGHEDPDIEVVVARANGYVIVEKPDTVT
jgi:hypothetical protein